MAKKTKKKKIIQKQDSKKLVEKDIKELIESDKIVDQKTNVKDQMKEIKHLQSELEKKLKDIEIEKASLLKREIAIKESEIKRDTGFQKEKKEFIDKYYAEYEQQKESQNIEIEKNRKSSIEKTQADIDQMLKDCEEQIKDKNDRLNDLDHAIKDREKNVSKNENEYKTNLNLLDSREDILEEKEKKINDLIDLKLSDRIKSFDEEKEQWEIERKRLSEEYLASREEISIYEELKLKLNGETPEKVLLDLNSLKKTIDKLKKELAEKPTQEMLEKWDSMEKEIERLTIQNQSYIDENYRLKKDTSNEDTLKIDLMNIKSERDSLKVQLDNKGNAIKALEGDLKRFRVLPKEERDKRIQSIESPYFIENAKRFKENMDKSEIEWIENIENKCIEYGFKFNPRMLRSFHTSLKTAEMSPLTILSGVSGTGKSELPRLYSWFGGINFLSLPVEPNWDSPESMLGFFNSIDNRFDAQPILQLLVQTQKNITKEYAYGLKDTVSLILLDEMNLAHVELYFSEFLSKLELRRGKGRGSEPSINVKLGSGLDPYQVPLGRNVLWAGTMNQDETTKSLSDKVLDRGIEIHFPRPKNLERRKTMQILGKKPFEKSELITYRTWSNWKKFNSEFTDSEIKPYKEFIEQTNSFLSNAGRSIGHRVWQSIEYYLANHPDVIVAKETENKTNFEQAMKNAFEDQLVQKVMPKLRGIEARGKSKTDCLDKIKEQLIDNDYSIVEDFDFACEYGYGQFMWNSAKYLDIESNLENKSIEEKENKKESNKKIKPNNDKEKINSNNDDFNNELDKQEDIVQE